MQKSEEKFSKAFEASPMPLSLSRLEDGVYLEVNESFEQFYGFTRNEAVGKRAVDLGLWTPPDWAELTRVLQREGRVRNKEYWIRAKDGILRAGLISAELIEIDGELCVLISAVDVTALKHVQEALMAEKTLTDSVFTAVPGVLFLMDEDGNPIRWNKQAERFTGYSAQELLSLNVFELHANRNRIRELFGNVPGAGHAEFETEIRRKDGGLIPFYCTAAYVFIDGKRYLVEVGVDLTERRRGEKERLGLSARLISAQDEERSRIARELHDDVSQKVALLGIQLDQLLQSSFLSSTLTSQVSEMKTRAMELASTLHNLSREIHPSNLSRLGFRIALQGLCRDMTQRGLLVHLTCPNVLNPLPSDISLCLFRVAQEALNNVMKHSGAKEAQVEVVAESGGIRMRITDRGRGFDPESKDFQAGLGLLSMRERIHLVGGDLSIRRQPGGGMEIEARVFFKPIQIALSA